MNEPPSQAEIDDVFYAFYELSNRYRMIYGVDYKSLTKVLEFWNELGKKEMERLDSLRYEPGMKAPMYPTYDENWNIIG